MKDIPSGHFQRITEWEEKGYSVLLGQQKTKRVNPVEEVIWPVNYSLSLPDHMVVTQ